MASDYSAARRWRLIRTVLVFQLKLIVDGFRDLLLVPVSLVAGIIDLVQGRSVHSGSFREVLAWGRRSERWIDLFGPLPHADHPRDEGRLDRLVDQVEEQLREQVRKGGVTASAKNSLDQWLDRLQRQQAAEGDGRAYWEQRYTDQNMGWDRGEASPALAHWQLEQHAAGQRIAVPGCGLGWEVSALARAGAEVIAIDLVEEALDRLHDRLAEEDLQAELLLEDVTRLRLEPPVDLIYEQTCLCALPPERREAYAKRLYQWLKPGGTLYALFMQTGEEGGPPHDCPVEEMQALFDAQHWHWPEAAGTRIDHPSGLHEIAVALIRK